MNEKIKFTNKNEVPKNYKTYKSEATTEIRMKVKNVWTTKKDLMKRPKQKMRKRTHKQSKRWEKRLMNNVTAIGLNNNKKLQRTSWSPSEWMPGKNVKWSFLSSPYYRIT